MSDPAPLGLSGPPPLPASPLPALPASPPPLPPAANVVTSGPYYQPPVYFRTEEPQPQQAGEPKWVLWGMFAFIALMVGGGLVAFVATRRGPSTASARVMPPPAAPRPAPRVVTPPPRVVAPVPVTVPPPSVRRPAPANGFPRVALPRMQEANLQLKKFWQAAESAGAQTRTILTLKSVVGPDAIVQPVQIELSARLPQVVEFLQGLRTAAPTAILDTIEVTDAAQATGGATGSGAVRVVLTVDSYFADETTPDTSASLCPHPDVAGALVDLSNLSEGKFRFTRVAAKIEAAAAATQSRVRPTFTVEALAQSDVDAAGYVSRLNASRRFREVNLVVVDAAQIDGQTYRKFTIEMRQAGDASFEIPRPAGALERDVFGTTLAPSPPPPTRPKQPNPAELTPAEAQRRVGQLALESVTGGRSPSCVINGRLYRAGHVVNGLTIEQITADGVVVRGGGQRFELKLPKP